MDSGEPPRTAVRLTRKYADAIDGIDLSQNKVGDLLSLPHQDARMLIAEGWATPHEAARNNEGPDSPES
jgi:hypothetical protein